MKPLHALTGLRFFAAISILVFHYGVAFIARAGTPDFIVRIFHNGYLGVSLFFVLSGFILNYRHRSDALTGRALADFYVARFARIYPVYLLALLLMLPVLFAPLHPREVAAVLTLLQSWTPPASKFGSVWVFQAWTLSVELFFYLLFPVIMATTRKWSGPFAIAFAVVTAVLIVVFGVSSITPGTTDVPYVHHTRIPIPVFRLLEFIFGVLLCRIALLYPKFVRLISGNIANLIVLVGIVALMSYATSMQSKAVITLLFGLLIVQLMSDSGHLSAALSTKTMALLGGASYSIYMLQVPVCALCDRFMPFPLNRFSGQILTLGGAIVVFLFWEQPSRKFITSSYKALIKKGKMPVKELNA